MFDQLDFRLRTVLETLFAHGNKHEYLSYVVVRGGLLLPLPSSAYEVSEEMLDALDHRTGEPPCQNIFNGEGLLIMTEGCTQDCGSCGMDCTSRDSPNFRVYLAEGSSVEKVIGIVSGKGGVGKSLVTALLACGTNRDGYKTAILDADITGPSIPKAFGLMRGSAITGLDGAHMLPGLSKGDIEVMSSNLLLEHETDPIIWRGPVIANVVKQFWSETIWTDVKYMFVDMPSGTGDIPITVFQSLERHINEIAASYGLPLLAKLPLDPRSAQAVDAGAVEMLPLGTIADAVAVVEKLSAKN